MPIFFVYQDRGGFLHLLIGEMDGTIQNLLKYENILFAWNLEWQQW